MTYDCFVLAGYDADRPDELAQFTRSPRKALVPIAGQPMVWHVVQSLRESGRIGRIVIVGMGPEDGVEFGTEIDYLPNGDSMWDNQNAAVRFLEEVGSADRFIFSVAADAPLLTGTIINEFIDRAQPLDQDLYWGIVAKEVMVRTFPLSQRSYMPLREGRFCSGDIYLGRVRAALAIQTQMRAFLDNRKSVFRQLRLLGISTIFRFIFRRLSISHMEAVAERLFGVQGKPVILPYAEAGMDIDKPHQLTQVLEYLESHREHPINQRPRSTAPVFDPDSSEVNEE